MSWILEMNWIVVEQSLGVLFFFFFGVGFASICVTTGFLMDIWCPGFIHKTWAMSKSIPEHYKKKKGKKKKQSRKYNLDREYFTFRCPFFAFLLYTCTHVYNYIGPLLYQKWKSVCYLFIITAMLVYICIYIYICVWKAFSTVLALWWNLAICCSMF